MIDRYDIYIYKWILDYENNHHGYFEINILLYDSCNLKWDVLLNCVKDVMFCTINVYDYGINRHDINTWIL